MKVSSIAMRTVVRNRHIIKDTINKNKTSIHARVALKLFEGYHNQTINHQPNPTETI